MDRLTEEYRLLRRLGRGGMGEVWEAVRVKDNGIVVPCAIKLLHADFTETARERRLFFAEALIATQLDHSRVVKVTDLDMARNGRPFLVMERVDGVDLRSFLEAGRERSADRFQLELDVITYIIGEILFALTYAHGRNIGDSDAGVIHSDVTPGNILLSSCGEVKLTDFGIARFAATAGPMSRAVGTPRYMSPEQLSGEPERATDIYGLGVVLHELLEGERFLDGLTPDQFRSRVLMGPPPELKRDDVPKWLDELRMRMIATDPRQRPSASEARAVLVEHCPRYLAAAVQLEADYAQLIGRRRSGMTQLSESEEVGDTAFVPPPAGSEEVGLGEARPDSPAVAEDDGDEVVVAPTELLPATKEPQTKPELTRWLGFASALAALAMCFLGLSFLVQALREPKTESSEADGTQLTQPVMARTQPEGATPQPELTPPIQERPLEPAPSPVQPTPPPAGLTPLAGAELEATGDGQTGVEPEPRPKAKPKIGVMFVVETKLEGKLKAGRKIIPIKGRSGYAELTPGSYKISWQPEGSYAWQAHGRITVKDISPSRYKVRLKDGEIAEFAEL